VIGGAQERLAMYLLTAFASITLCSPGGMQRRHARWIDEVRPVLGAWLGKAVPVLLFVKLVVSDVLHADVSLTPQCVLMLHHWCHYGGLIGSLLYFGTHLDCPFAQCGRELNSKAH